MGPDMGNETPCRCSINVGISQSTPRDRLFLGADAISLS